MFSSSTFKSFLRFFFSPCFDALLYFFLLYIAFFLPYFYKAPSIVLSLQDLLPTPYLASSILEHQYYRAAYSSKHKQSEYIFYLSKVEYLVPNCKRTNQFKPDPLLKESESATLKDYQRSGYDRGHILPAGDMTFDRQALEETFYLSNICPQVPEFNRGIWCKLEALVRKWVKEKGSLLVISGPILEKQGKVKLSIGEGHVTVPWAFYKIVFNLDSTSLIAFILPNEPLSKEAELQDFVVTVKEVERETGINFFAKLPEDWQDYWENQVDIYAWSW